VGVVLEQLPLNAPKSVTATFFVSSYQLSLSTTINKGTTYPFVLGAPVIQSSPAGINCGGYTGDVCSYFFNKDSKVSLMITILDNQYMFSAWGGACAGKAQNNCTVSMTAAQTVTATFVTNQLNIYLEPNGSVGTVTASPSSDEIRCYSVNSSQQGCFGTNSFGKTVVLKATPVAGYKFTGWSGACTGTTNPCTVTMNGPKTVSANFAQQ